MLVFPSESAVAGLWNCENCNAMNETAIDSVWMKLQFATNACVSFGKCTAGLRLNYRIEAKMIVQWLYRMCNDCSSCLNACERVQCRAAGADGDLAEYVLRLTWCSSWIGATARSNCNTFQRLQDLCLQSFQAMRHAMLLLLDTVAHYGIVAKQRKI